MAGAWPPCWRVPRSSGSTSTLQLMALLELLLRVLVLEVACMLIDRPREVRKKERKGKERKGNFPLF